MHISLKLIESPLNVTLNHQSSRTILANNLSATLRLTIIPADTWTIQLWNLCHLDFALCLTVKPEHWSMTFQHIRLDCSQHRCSLHRCWGNIAVTWLPEAKEDSGFLRVRAWRAAMGLRYRNWDPPSTISWINGCGLCKTHPQQAFRLTWGRMRLLSWFEVLVGWLAGHGGLVYVLMEKPRVQHWPDWTWRLELPNCPSQW